MAWSKATKAAAAAKSKATKQMNAQRTNGQQMAEQPQPSVRAVVPVTRFSDEFRVSVKPGSQVTFRIGPTAITVIGE